MRPAGLHAGQPVHLARQHHHRQVPPLPAAHLRRGPGVLVFAAKGYTKLLQSRAIESLLSYGRAPLKVMQRYKIIGLSARAKPREMYFLM